MPNELCEGYNDRMPVILDPKDYEIWLDPKAEKELLFALLTPFEADRKRVSRLRGDASFRVDSK